jgi:hypothetical protein
MEQIFSPEQVPPFYQGYVARVQGYELLEALEFSSEETARLLSQIPESLGTFAYAPAKWTVKELLQHMMDAERVFAFRALTFARNDKTHLPPFDENAYVPESNAHAVSITEMAGSMERLRATTLDLFRSFTPEMLKRKGVANNNEMSVEGIGYIIAGHELHHLAILTERYLKKW